MDELFFSLLNIDYNRQEDLCRVLAPVLSDEDKHRVCLIEDLNKIQVALGGGNISPATFERYMCLPIHKMESYILDQSSLLNRIKYEEALKRKFEL